MAAKTGHHEGVSTDSGQWPKPGRAPASSVARGVLPALNARARHEVDRAKPPARSLQRCSRLSTGARGASAAPVRTRNRGIWFELDHLNNLNRSEESGEQVFLARDTGPWTKPARDRRFKRPSVAWPPPSASLPQRSILCGAYFTLRARRAQVDAAMCLVGGELAARVRDRSLRSAVAIQRPAGSGQLDADAAAIRERERVVGCRRIAVVY